MAPTPALAVGVLSCAALVFAGLSLSAGCRSSGGGGRPLAELLAELAAGTHLKAGKADGYWARPLRAQGPHQLSWSPLERSLYPEDCGICHPAQLADWKGALHSRAMGPGLVGQLLHSNSDKFARSCDHCHAPLFEQRQRIQTASGKWVDNGLFDQRLRDSGVSCSVCHVRGRNVAGPEPSSGGPRQMSALPHGGFTIDEQFSSGQICAACHQFPDNWKRLNGKLIEDTFNEWKASPAFAEGKSCTSCHMPERRHLFRGIHDPEMTRSAFDFEARLTGGEAGAASEAIAVLTNVGAGHMAPTYVTPRIEMDFILVDGQGKEIGEPSEPTVIQRHVVLGGKDEREVFDTRLAQGASAEARWSVERVPGAAAVVARVRCIPDHYYEQFFEQRLTRYPADGEPHRLLQQALDEARARRFVIFEERLELD